MPVRPLAVLPRVLGRLRRSQARWTGCALRTLACGRWFSGWPSLTPARSSWRQRRCACHRCKWRPMPAAGRQS